LTTRLGEDDDLARFADQLYWEADPAKRETLQSSLLEEERRLGCTVDQLAKAERRLSDGGIRIARQTALIGELKAAGYDVGRAERLLDNLKHIQELFAAYHGMIVQTLDRRRP
jgi:hypothetical protein